MKKYSKSYQEKVNLENVNNLLEKAIDTWSSNAPSPDGFFTKELQNLFRYKSKKVMDTAYQWLFTNHQSSYFPAPAKWIEAVKYAEMINSTGNDCGDWLSLEKVGDRFITKFEKKVLDLVKGFENSPIIDEFKAKDSWDKIRDNYTYLPNSLTAYVVELFKVQLAILNNIPVGIQLEVADQAYCKSAEFREMTLKRGYVSLDLLRKSDVDQLLEKEEKRNIAWKNSKFREYSIKDVIERLSRKFKMV